MGIGDKIFGLGALLSFDAGNAFRTMEQGTAATGRLRSGLSGVGDVSRAIRSDLTKLAVAAAPVATAFALGTRSAVAWDTGLRRINTLLGEQSEQVLPQLDAGLDGLSRRYGLLASDAQEAAFQAISASIPAGKAIEFMGVASKAAVGGTTELTTAVDGLTNTLNAFALEASEAERVSDAFFIANKRGKTTIAELARFLGGVAPTFAAAGGSVEELTSSIARITKVGVRTSEAATGIKAAITAIIGPSEEAKKAAKKLNLEFSVAGMRRAGGFVPFLAEVEKKTGGNIVQLRKLFSSVEAVNSVTALTARGGLADVNAILDETRGAVGATTEAFDKMASGPAFKMRQLRSLLDSLLRQLGKMALPVLDALSEVGQEAAKWIDQNEGRVRAFFGLVKDEVGKVAKWIRGSGGKAMKWVLENAEGILRATKGTLDLWIKIRTVQLAVAAIQAGMAGAAALRGGMATARGAGAGGVSGFLMAALSALTGSAGMAGGSIVAGGRVAQAALGAGAGEAGAAMAAGGQAAGASMAAGGRAASGIVGTPGAPGALFQPAMQGLKSFGGVFAVLGAGMVGWTIGKWLNSIGADDLVYKGIRGWFGGGGETPEEARATAKAHEAASLRLQKQRKLAWLLRQEWFDAETSEGRTMGGQARRSLIQTLGDRPIGEMPEGMWLDARQAILDFTSDARANMLNIVRGSPEWRRARELAAQIEADPSAFGLRGWKKGSGAIMTKEEIRRIFDEAVPKESDPGARRPTVNVDVPVSVNLDGRQVGQGLGRRRGRDAQRGAEESYSLTQRNLVVRGGIVSAVRGFRMPAPVGVGGTA